MKKGLIFFFGMIAGSVLTVLILALIGMAKDSEGNNFPHEVSLGLLEKELPGFLL